MAGSLRQPRHRRRPGVESSAVVAVLELVEARVADPEMMGDLVVDRVGHARREGLGRPIAAQERVPEERDLAGSATWSAPYAVRGTPWYRPYRPYAPTVASCCGLASSSMTMATEPSRSANSGGSASSASMTNPSITSSIVGRPSGGPDVRSARPARLSAPDHRPSRSRRAPSRPARIVGATSGAEVLHTTRGIGRHRPSLRPRRGERPSAPITDAGSPGRSRSR